MAFASLIGNKLLTPSMHSKTSAHSNNFTKPICPVISKYRIEEAGTPDCAANVFLERLAATCEDFCTRIPCAGIAGDIFPARSILTKKGSPHA